MATLLKSSVNGICVGRGANSCTGTTAIGILALQGIANVANRGCFNTAVGYNALRCTGTANFGLRNTAVGACASICNTGGGCNVAIGFQALRYNTTGFCNTAVGYKALVNPNTGCYNTAFGSFALANSSTGLRNTAVGFQAMGGATVTGCNNTAIGASALRNVTSGWENTMIGFQAGYRNSTGCRNTAFGANALCNNCIGSYNTAFGYAASRELNNSTGGNTAFGSRAAQRINGKNNTAFGFKALYGAASSTGYNNTAFGAFALAGVSTGKGNTGFGFKAGCAITSGCFNTMHGTFAGCSITTTNGSTMVGYKAGVGMYSNRNITIGSYAGAISTATSDPDLMVGFCAGKDNDSTGYNLFIGAKAGFGVSGRGNTAVGYKAGYSPTSVSYNNEFNTFIGSCAYPTFLGDKFTYNIAVGYYSRPDGTPGHTMWGASFNSVNNETNSAWVNVSDCRDKTNIKDLNPKLGLEFIKKLRPVSFNWDIRDEYVRKCGFEYGQKDGTLVQEQEEYGYISQEIRDILNELDIKWDAIGDNGKVVRLQSSNLHASHIKAIQELYQRVISLKERVTALT
jgi:trimeric autotransporter adhesin